MAAPARAAGRSPTPSTVTDFCQRENRASIQPTQLDLGLALRPPTHMNKCPSHLHEEYKILNSFLGSRTTREGEWTESRNGGAGRKRSASRAKPPPTVERKQAKRRKVKHGRQRDLVPQSRPLRYKSCPYLVSLALSAAMRNSGRLPSAL